MWLGTTRFPQKVVESPSLETDVEKPSGHGPGQVTLGDPAWAGEVGQDIQRELSTSNILWFCDKKFMSKGCQTIPASKILWEQNGIL